MMIYCGFFQMLAEVDTLLFSLLVLRGLTDCQGRVWRCHHSQLYVVEVTCSDRNAVRCSLYFMCKLYVVTGCRVLVSQQLHCLSCYQLWLVSVLLNQLIQK